MTSFKKTVATSLSLVALLATGCGKARSTAPAATNVVTFPGGGADGSTVVVQNAQWCVKCHGDAAKLTTDAAPGYAFAPTSGAHAKHLLSFVECGDCHVVPPTGASHTTGPVVDLKYIAAARGATGVSFTSGQCASTYCHGNWPAGNGAQTMTWTDTTPLTCTSCHADPPAIAAHGGITSADNCGACHPDFANHTVTDPSRHVDGIVQGGCTVCHGTDGRSNSGIPGVAYDDNQAAAPPKDTNGLGAGEGVLVGAHLAHVNPLAGSAVYKPFLCTECHPDNTAAPHDGVLEVTFANATGFGHATWTPTQGNGATVATTCATYCHNGAADAPAGPTSWTGGPADCTFCHGFPPLTGHTGVASNVAACAGCHGGTITVTAGVGTINVGGGLHINGVVDGGESTGGQACGGCHPTIVAGIAGSAASKHALTLYDPALQTGIGWSEPLSGNLAAVRSCTNMCHDDHPHEAGGASDHSYNVYADANVRATAADTTTRARTDFDGTAAYGGLCVSCHQFGIVGGGPTIDEAAYSASAHDFTAFTAGTTWTWEYALHKGAFDRNCTKCHASNSEGRTPSVSATTDATSAAAVHFNADNASLLAGTTTPIAAGLVCFNCHGSAAPTNGNQGDRSGVDIQTQFAKASSHTAVGTCLDCHDPHRAKQGDHATPGNLAGPPIEGASGAEFTAFPAFWTAPAAGAFTTKTIAAGADLEATLCFKCHSSFAATLPAGTTDVAMEFNPNNVGNYATTGAATWENLETAGSFHPVLATAAGNLGAVRLINLQTPWSTTSRNLMTCTDCHGSNDPADPTGPHGSTADFILKGPNTTWSAAVVSINNGTNGWMPAQTFCLNCHKNDTTTSRFAAHTNSNHRIECWNCHSAIPHGGPRPGLLVAPFGVGSGAALNPPPVIPTYDQSAPYFMLPASTDKLFIKAYPTSNGANWTSTGLCGCNSSTTHT